MKLHVLGAVIAALLLPVASAYADEPIEIIPVFKPKNPAMVELGKKLYFDPRLSKSGFISCNSCHNLSMGGTDNLKTSIGHNWQQGPINSPTVLNSSMNLAQFWDGRAKDLKAQAGGPIANPGEMAFTHELAVDMLNSIPAYKAEFKSVFGKDVANIVNGATRITNVHYNSELIDQAENIRKLFLAMSADIRVLLVRLAACLQDMVTLGSSPKERQRRLARETMDLYAPLASRLGIDWMKRDLEDMAFQYLFPVEHADIAGHKVTVRGEGFFRLVRELPVALDHVAAL